MKPIHYLLILVLLAFPHTLPAENQPPSASWKYCKTLLKRIRTAAEKRQQNDLAKAIQMLRNQFMSAKGTNWPRLAIAEHRLRDEIFINKDDPHFPFRDIEDLLHDLERIRAESIPRILSRVRKFDGVKTVNAVNSLYLSSIHPLTALEAGPAFLELLNDTTDHFKRQATENFWPIFREIKLLSENDKKFEPLYKKFEDSIPQVIELWASVLAHDNTLFADYRVDPQFPEPYTEDFRKLNSILENDEVYLSFSRAVTAIDAFCRFNQNISPENASTIFSQDFYTRFKFLGENRSIPERIVLDDSFIVQYSGEFYLAAHNPNTSAQTKKHLQIIMSFLLKKIELMKLDDPFDKGVSEMLASVPFRISDKSEANLIAKIWWDTRPHHQLIHDIKIWMLQTHIPYHEIQDIKGNLLHQIAAKVGKPELAQQLENHFLKKD